MFIKGILFALVLIMAPVVSFSAIIFSDYIGVFDEMHESQSDSAVKSKPDNLNYLEEDIRCHADQSKQLFCHDIKDNSMYRKL